MFIYLLMFISIAFLFGVFAFIKRTQKNVVANSAQSPEEIYKAWQKSSWVSKIINAWSTIGVIAIFALMILGIVVGVGMGLEWKPIQNFVGKFLSFQNKEVALLSTKKILKYTIIYVIILFIWGRGLHAMTIYSYIDMAYWFSRFNVDCYEALRTSGKTRCRTYVGNAYLIKERPNTQMIHLIQWLLMTIASVLAIVAISFFMRTTIEQAFGHIPDAETILKNIFLSFGAILLYISFIATIILNIAFGRILDNKLNESLALTFQNNGNE